MPVARHELGTSGNEDESAHQVAVMAPKLLGDRTTHRVSGCYDRTGGHLVECRGGIVGTIGKPEAPSGPDPATMTPVIDGDHVEVVRQGLETSVPVESPAGEKSVKEEHGGSPIGARGMAHECGASPRQLEPRPERHEGPFGNVGVRKHGGSLAHDLKIEARQVNGVVGPGR